MNPFVAEIRIFPFNFAPVGWALCQGQLLPISQYAAVFSLLGTNYGGNGQSTFGLPNFQGIVPMHWEQGPGLSNYVVGETGGTQNVTLLTTQLPSHNHALSATSASGTLKTSNGNQLAAGLAGSKQASSSSRIYSTNPPTVNLIPQSVSQTGGNLPHNNMMPYLTLNFCIALQGVYPSRS